MTYNASYTESDITPVIFDGISKAFLTGVAFVSLIVLVFIWKYLKKAMK